jgi:hypothetical protein
MDDSEEDEGTGQLVASEASAAAKGGWGDCNDLAIWRDVDANAHAGMRKGTRDLSSSNAEVALKKNREKQVRYRKNMSAEKRAGEQKRLDSIRANETEAQYTDQMEKECKQSTTCLTNQTDKMRVQRGNYMREYMRKKKAKATLPPFPEEEEADNLTADPPQSPEEEEEADAAADPPPSPEQDAEAIAVEVLMTLTNEASPYETK